MNRLSVAACRLTVTALLCGVSAVAFAETANGLIVKLKDAPSHERIQSSGASAQSSETQRLYRVLQSSRMTEARLKPVGRDAQHLDFGRRLSTVEANALAEKLRADPNVEWVEPNTREKLMQSSAGVPPNDLYYGYRSGTDTGQWWLRPPPTTANPVLPTYGVPDVESAWALSQGQPIVVAVLDTGITSHPDLPSLNGTDRRLLPGYDFVSDADYANDNSGRDNDPSDPGDWVSQDDINNNPGKFAGCEVANSSWHGTVITGIVGATTNNSVGVAGINRFARILPVRVAGKCGAELADIIDGMRWAAGLHVDGVTDNPTPARVVNISFGGSSACGPAYQSAVNELAQRGVVVVAAAGNGSNGVGAASLSRPASCSGVVAVTALAQDGLKAEYSNFGAQVTVSTVGGDPLVDDGILTVTNAGTRGPVSPPLPNLGYAGVFGTSFATPIVSGVVSLMLSVNSNLTVNQVIAGLRSSAVAHVRDTNVATCSASNTGACACTTSTCGAGILDAVGALQYAVNPPPAAGDGGSNGGGGGGALGPVWLAGLALAIAALAWLSSGARRARGERLAE